jgi:hypothetical protein
MQPRERTTKGLRPRHGPEKGVFSGLTGSSNQHRTNWSLLASLNEKTLATQTPDNAEKADSLMSYFAA